MDVSQMVRLVTSALLVGTTSEAPPRHAPQPPAVAGTVQSLRDAVMRQFDGDPAARRLVGGLGALRIVAADAETWYIRLHTLIGTLPEPRLRALVPQAQAVLSLTRTAAGDPFTDDRAVTDRFTLEQFAANGDDSARSPGTPPAGGPHPPATGFRAGLSLTNTSTGQVAAVVSVQEELTAEARRLRGADHPDTLAARAELAHLYWWAGRGDDARTTMRHVAADRERLLGGAHAETLAAKAALRDWEPER